MPRWLLPAVVVGDVVVIGVLYAVLGWPALIVGFPLVICSVVVIVVLSVNGSRSPVPYVARAFVQASGHARGPGGPFRPGSHDDDWYLRNQHARFTDHGWTSHRGGPDDGPHSWSHHHTGHDHGSHGWTDPGCSDPGTSSSWSDSGSSSSDSGCSTSDSGSSSSSSDSGSSSSSSSD